MTQSRVVTVRMDADQRETMLDALDEWNAKRKADGKPAISLNTWWLLQGGLLGVDQIKPGRKRGRGFPLQRSE